MDSKSESKINATSGSTTANESCEPAGEETTADLLSKSSADVDNDVSPPPGGGKGATKKIKGKAKGAASNNLDNELKKLTQRRINVAGAPKMPLNSYVRFMNDRREQLRREHPNRTALEHTKMIGEEWHQLTEDRRAPYMEAAAKDKALYQEQMHKFLTEHPEIVANELAKAKKVFDTKNASTPKEKATNNDLPSNHAAPRKSNPKTPLNKQQSAPTPDPDDIPLAHVKRSPTPPPQPPVAGAFNPVAALPRPFAAGEIPIYTNEFIEHNRSTENELRLLRKTKTDLEQQNSVLEQHVDNTKTGHAKVMGEVAELKEENARLMAYIKGLRQKVVGALDGITLPPLEPSGLSVDNVDKYLQHLAGMVSGQQNNAMLLKVSELLGKMDTATLHRP
ncbi:SWI/SNF-related matrix-associated actin-dependent regulator of chromatin subfamily E member 1-related [Drosophila nasuta]|uniref:SWI/SNF-related matrix-associated actin-dependent regulator of chromatin subfamily E member 1-related n=1 Tax=Drosophila nasuta TaxID=42062 RepID=UPI00295E52F2|nr:SWI/SNF-related matrix-associated actin-dependent regulator of chromatin subfamily E member 1-related [Drosophila nasuta]